MKVCIFFSMVVSFVTAPAAVLSQQQKEPGTQHYLSQIKPDHSWKLADSIQLLFTTHHTQGLTKVGQFYFLSAVKVNQWPRKYDIPVDGYDRDQGDGIGYLFKFDAKGQLVDSVQLGKGKIYHPGGIDFDGRHIWIPVCEYRPKGKSIIYRIHPETLQTEIVTHIDDAIGAVACNRQTKELVGMNWGSRIFYTWKINDSNGSPQAVFQPNKVRTNPHFYVDYQDCNYAGNGTMICSGLRTYKNENGEIYRLGGIELIDISNYTAGMQIPVSVYTSRGTIITNNPFYIEAINGRLQVYFVPEDDNSVMYIYRIE